MKQFFYKILSVMMAFVVLFSTMSFTINNHYCGDELVSSTLFVKGESCGMDMQKSTEEDNCTIKKDNCCTDEVIIVEGQKELKPNYFDLNLKQQYFAATFMISYVNLFDGLHNNIVPFKNYSPPLLVKKIHILDEVFLI
jgi:hypothetical protein